MALSFKEKRELQKSIEADFSSLATATGFKEKRELQKRIEANLAKLTGAEDKQEKSLYDRLIAGEFYSLAPIAFMAKLKEVAKEIGEDVAKLHDPSIEYLRIHESEIF